MSGRTDASNCGDRLSPKLHPLPYKALEAALRNEINNIERTHSGYDAYRYDLDEINHNPYELAAYLTVKFEDYTRDEVQAALQLSLIHI